MERSHGRIRAMYGTRIHICSDGLGHIRKLKDARVGLGSSRLGERAGLGIGEDVGLAFQCYRCRGGATVVDPGGARGLGVKIG